jgi:hypothetical protein
VHIGRCRKRQNSQAAAANQQEVHIKAPVKSQQQKQKQKQEQKQKQTQTQQRAPVKSQQQKQKQKQTQAQQVECEEAALKQNVRVLLMCEGCHLKRPTYGLKSEGKWRYSCHAACWPLYDPTFSRTVWMMYGGAKGLVVWC